MSFTCIARYVWNTDELVTAMQRHNSVRLRNEFRVLLKVTCALLLAFAVFLAIVSIVSPYDKPAPYWSLILIILICVYGLIYDRINVWFWKRTFRKRPDFETDVEWAFLDDAVKMKSSLGEATVKWKAFVKVVAVKDGFLFYSTEKFFHWVPFHSLNSINCVESIRELVIKNQCPFIKQK